VWQEWRSTVLKTTQRQLYLEPTYVFGCIRDGAKHTSAKRGTLQPKVASTLQIADDEIVLIDRWLPKGDLAPPLQAENEPVYLDVRSVRNAATRGRNIRYRVAASAGWNAEFTILWDNCNAAPSKSNLPATEEPGGAAFCTNGFWVEMPAAQLPTETGGREEVNRRHTAASCEKDAQELARALEAFVAKADAAEQATLLRVLRGWPQMRTLTMVTADRLYEQRKKVVSKKGAIQSAIARLFDDEDAYAIIVGRPNTAKAIRERIDLIENTVKSAAGLLRP
jgi:hypothetical protein